MKRLNCCSGKPRISLYWLLGGGLKLASVVVPGRNLTQLHPAAQGRRALDN
jgi:hypothetical protein